MGGIPSLGGGLGLQAEVHVVVQQLVHLTHVMIGIGPIDDVQDEVELLRIMRVDPLGSGQVEDVLQRRGLDVGSLRGEPLP